MIIWVDDHLFQEGARDVDRLALLRGAAIRRHTMVVSTDPRDSRLDRKAPGFDRWSGDLPDRLRHEVALLRRRLDLVSGNAIARGAERLLVSQRERGLWGDVPGCWVNLEEAVRAVVLPTYVLVENAINDRAFLRRVMPPAWRERLETWERTGLLRYEHGGGITELARLVERHAQDDYAQRAFGLPSRLWRLVHVVVYDHDGKTLTNPSGDSKRVEAACRDAGMGERSHRLRRRDQEHYLPREAMEAIVQQFEDPRVVEGHLATIAGHFAGGAVRHFLDLPNAKTFKNSFDKAIAWRDEWFERDGAWPEMTELAERIAAAI